MNKLIIVHNLEDLLNQVRNNKLTIAVLNGSCDMCTYGGEIIQEIADKFPDVNFIKVDISGSPEIMAHFETIRFNDVIIYFGGGIVLGPERWPGEKDFENLIQDCISMVHNRGCESCKDGFMGKCPGYAHCPYKDHTENEGD